jgi:hypothetical protein
MPIRPHKRAAAAARNTSKRKADPPAREAAQPYTSEVEDYEGGHIEKSTRIAKHGSRL